MYGWCASSCIIYLTVVRSVDISICRDLHSVSDFVVTGDAVFEVFSYFVLECAYFGVQHIVGFEGKCVECLLRNATDGVGIIYYAFCLSSFTTPSLLLCIMGFIS